MTDSSISQNTEVHEAAEKAVSAPRGTGNRSTTPKSSAFQEFIGSAWADRDDSIPAPREAAAYAANRRDAISKLYPGKRLVIPAGSLKQRSNDCDYPFRAHSAFSQLTGWGSDSEPGSVLVLEPTDDGHEATLYFRERAGRDSDEFYANPEIGEFWIGPRPSLAQVAGDLQLATKDLHEVTAVLDATDENTLVVREADEQITAAIDAAEKHASAADSAALHRDLSELRLVKDEYEISELRKAVDATARGFNEVIRELPRAMAEARGERVVEGVFNIRARLDGNTVGYDTIAAAGDHACILHWTANDGPVRDGDLILVDAGVEMDSLYTADITRTLPVNGRFSETQREVYETVLRAADEAFAIVKPGITFRDVHAKAMEVIAEATSKWGFLPVTLEEALEPTNGHHRRYMVHGTSHHLGIDVHDCAQARREMYMDAIVEPGMVFTIEPGLYFQRDDLTVDERFRGIGVRIEDDILVTEDGAENLSRNIPRTADEVEAWIAREQSR